MKKTCLALALFVTVARFGLAQPSLPNTFHAQTVHTADGTDIYVRSAGTGPVVVLLHGYAETSDSWAPLATDLLRDHTVIVPDLRGIGHSSHPAAGYDKKTEAMDIRAVVTALGYDRAEIVAHDIGNMVAYAYAAQFPDKVIRLAVMDAPLPGISPWQDVITNPGTWHFSFHGPDAERLVQGRERIYFDRIWNDFTGNPAKPDDATRTAYAAAYAVPGGMRAGFAQFTAFAQDAKDNQDFAKTKLRMPVLAVGGERSFGPVQAICMRNVAIDVREAVVPGAGHWLMEEKPAYTVALLREFLDEGRQTVSTKALGAGRVRLTPAEFRFPSSSNPGTGTSGAEGIKTVILHGDPDKPGLYTIMLRIPPRTNVAAHSHQDDRIATVISGTWAIGYGNVFRRGKLKRLPPGSFYTEPANVIHFAQTGADPVVVQITGVGPSSTTYVEAEDDPRRGAHRIAQ